MSIIKNTVLLLKSEKTDGDVDKYETLLKSKNFEVKLVKTLDFIYKNSDELKGKLLKPANFSGIIFSSPRCVNAVHQALNQDTIKELWQAKSNFVVGETTYKEVEAKLGLICKGKESGNANNLSKLIIDENANKTKFNKPFLFPHGNLKTDTLKQELGKENIMIEGCLVYETVANCNIEKELSIMTENFTVIPEFVVFFSPSGLRSSISYLRRIPIDLNQVKFIAIGPVTELAMKEENLQIYGVAKNPTPEDVLKIIIFQMIPNQNTSDNSQSCGCTASTQPKTSTCANLPITTEKALALRYSNFYNGYNIDYHNDGSWFKPKHKDDCHDRRRRAIGMTLDGQGTCCRAKPKEDQCKCLNAIIDQLMQDSNCCHKSSDTHKKTCT